VRFVHAIDIYKLVYCSWFFFCFFPLTLLFARRHQVADLKAVIYQMNSAVCFTRKINGTIPVPDTSKLTYLGQSILYYEPVYVWCGESSSKFRA
jgi:hypothetical protein